MVNWRKYNDHSIIALCNDPFKETSFQSPQEHYRNGIQTGRHTTIYSASCNRLFHTSRYLLYKLHIKIALSQQISGNALCRTPYAALDVQLDVTHAEKQRCRQSCHPGSQQLQLCAPFQVASKVAWTISAITDTTWFTSHLIFHFGK